MDRNSSLERRYSFNMAQGIPVADSTHLNGSGFSWGTSLSPKQRSNSSFCLNNTQNTTVDNISIAHSPKSKNISKIDARIAADVQSKGLASRIVKYHESGTRLNRSMSAHNLYSKPGQFPVVTLKKTELPYRATKQELSMIRIPPPEKSSFYGNTISSLLRSSSVLGLQSKRTEDLSGENRPIIHPPPTEDDMAPTRSVLDVLKEISRKRINSDDLEVDETSKKYCNRNTDFVDIGNNTMPAISSNYTAAASSCQRYKRQRDCITPQQNVHMTENKTSPEQDKKRVCSYNNDITSSLSSSMKYKTYGSAKRSSVAHNLNQTMPNNLESYEIQKAKMQRYVDHHNNDKNNTRVDVRFDNLENTLRNVDSIKPITPIPATPCTQEKQSDGVAPMRTVSEPIYNSDRKIVKNYVQPAYKPRLTLFNKKYEEDESSTINESHKTEAENTNGFDDFGECSGIQFVKPKKISSISGLRNPVIERTQKSKLALMLSGLRGELYQNSEADELDSAKEKPPKTEEVKPNPIITTVTSSIQQSTTATVTTVTTAKTCSSVGISTASSTFSLSKTTVSPPTLSTISTNKTASPLVGLKLTQPSFENAITTTSTNATKATESSNIPKVSVLGGFSFGANNTTTTITSAVANTTTSVSTTKDHKTTVITTTTVPSTTTNLLNFGGSTQLTSSSSQDTNKLSATKENSLQFPSVGTAFSLPAKNTTASMNTATSATTTTAFTFGTNVTCPTPTSVTNTASNNAVKPNNSFNFTVPSTSASVPNSVFGSLITSTIPASSTTSSITANTTTSGFTFGAVVASSNSTISTTPFTFSTTKPTTKTNETPPVTSSGPGNSSLSFSFGSNATQSVPAFGTNTNTALKPQQPTSGFSFNSDTKIQSSPSVDTNKSAAVKQSESNVFGFGSPKPASTTAVAAPIFGSTSNSLSNATSIFGSNSNKTEPPTFGSIGENKSATTSVFGASSSNNSASMFGAGADNKTAAPGTTSVFGGGGSGSNSSTTTPFSFGSNPAIAQTTNTNNANNTAGGFSFGSTASNNSQSAPFAFGAKPNATTNTTANAFGGASSTSGQNTSFSFSSSANKSDNPPNVFGAAVNKPTENVASPGGFSFGSALSPKTGNFSFGSGSGGNSFAGGSVSNPNNSTSGFSFGASTASKPNEVPTGSTSGFSFGGAAASKPNEISTSSSSGFSFGATIASKPNEVSTNSSSGFSFGGATTAKPSDINKPFSFNSSQSQQQQQQPQQPLGSNNPTNIFGANTSSKTAPPPAFNFNAGNSTNIQSNTPATNNIFAPPSLAVTTGPGDRPIRRATRRLQK